MLIDIFRRQQPRCPRSCALGFQHTDLDRTGDAAGIEPDGVLERRGNGELAFGNGGRPFRPKDVAQQTEERIGHELRAANRAVPDAVEGFELGLKVRDRELAETRLLLAAEAYEGAVLAQLGKRLLQVENRLAR